MAITVTDRGTGANSTNQASTACTTSGTIAVGSTGLLVLAADNANGASTNMPGTITDSVGNTWNRRQGAATGGANASVEMVVYTSYLANALTSSDNVTVTYTNVNVTAKAWSFVEIAPANATDNYCIMKEISANVGNSTGTTPSVASSVAQVGEVFVGMIAVEYDDSNFSAFDSDTTNGSWSTAQHTGTGTTTTGMSVGTQWKIQTTTSSTQSWNVTLANSTDSKFCGIKFTEVPKAVKKVLDNGTSETTTTLTFTENIASGSTCAMVISMDNAGLNGNTPILPSTLTDSASNTWTLRQDAVFDNGAAAAGAEVGIYTATLTTIIQANDNVQIAYASSTAVVSKQIVVYGFTDATDYANSGVSAGSTTASPTITTSSITGGNYVIGVLAMENQNNNTDAPTVDTDSTNGTWSTATISAGTAGLASMGIITQYKKTTGSGTQTYNITLNGGTNDSILGWVELTVPSAISNTQYSFFQFFN